METCQPVDQSDSERCQVVTANGEGLFHRNEHDLSGDPEFTLAVSSIKAPQDEIPISISKSKALTSKGNVTITEFDVSSGNITEPVDLNLKTVKIPKAPRVVRETPLDNLNILLRHGVFNCKIKSQKKSVFGVQAENYVMPESFADVDRREDNFNYDTKLHNECLPGYVVRGRKQAVISLLNSDTIPKAGTHGVIVEDAGIVPSYDGLYEEGHVSQYRTGKVLGKGSFGTVYLCRHANGKVYVTKMVKNKFNRKEVEVLMLLSHSNIVQFLGYVLRDDCHEIMMEYGGVSLKTFIDENRKRFQDTLTYNVICELSVQGFSALQYMHDMFGILHLDIKPENICVSFKPPTLKLTDFGTSKTPQQPISFDGWTPEYMSPEACRRVLASKLPADRIPVGFLQDLAGIADVFAFGLVICYMQTGSHVVSVLWPPKFTVQDLSTFRPQYILHLATNPSFALKLAVKDNWTPEMKELINNTLEGDPHLRWTASDACVFVKRCMLLQVSIPDVLPSDLHTDQVDSSDSPYTCPASPMDLGQPYDRPAGGGKDIKNQLRRKLRRSQTGPYILPAEKTPVHEGALPNFGMIMD